MKVRNITKYSRIENNAEVMDVLCCVIFGHNKVKAIMEELKQPQSTISEKLRFLRQNKVVKKNKWEFKPNWEVIVKIFQKEVKGYFAEPRQIQAW